MKKQIVGIILGIAIISLASAMYAGECLPVDLSELENLDNVVYDVVGNSSNLEGLTIEINGTIANICTVTNYQPDSFTIIFIDNSTKTIIKEVPVGGGGGGSSSTRIIYKNQNVTVEVPTYIYGESPIKDSDDSKEPKDYSIFKWISLILSVTIIFLILKLMTEKESNSLKETNINEKEEI